MTAVAASGSHAALVGVEVLVLDGDERVHAGIEQLLSEASLHVTCTTDPERAIALVDQVAGRDPARAFQIDELRVLVVDEVDDFFEAIKTAAGESFTFVHATSGGEGLDRISSAPFHYAMVAEDITDLPATTIA